MSLLDIIPGGSYLQAALTTASKKASSEASIIKGTVGKAYYSTQTSLYNAVGSTAQVAKTVTTGVRNYATYALIAVAFVVLWPFIAPMLAEMIGSVFQRRSA